MAVHGHDARTLVERGKPEGRMELGCGYLTFKALASFGSYVGNIIRLPLAIKD